MRNIYWQIESDQLQTALAKGQKNSRQPHQNVHYSSLQAGSKIIIQGDYTDQEIDYFKSKPWAHLHGIHEKGFVKSKANYISNPFFYNNGGNWTLGAGYTINSDNDLVWNSETDTVNTTYQDLIVPTGKNLLITFSYSFAMVDIENLLTQTSIGTLNNARILILKKSDLSVIGTTYLGDTGGLWERRGFIFKSSVESIRIVIMGRRAGTGRWKGFACRELNPSDIGRYKNPTLSLPSFKGGNLGTMQNASGQSIANNWLSSSNYTANNKNAWRQAFNNMYLGNNLKVCRIFLNVAGNFSNVNHIFSSDWSALNNTEVANLRDFFTNVVPNGLKIIPVISYHSSISESIYNTALTPSLPHQTQSNFLNRVAEVVDILVDYKSKIAMWEAINEPNLNIGANVSIGNVRDLMKLFYDMVKTKDSIVPVGVSHQNMAIFAHHELLIKGTADIIATHFYGTTPILPESNTMLSIIPEVMQLPCIMAEGRHINGAGNPDINTPYLQQANDIYYALGYEGFYPWTIKGYGGDNGSSPLDLDWSEERGNLYLDSQ